MKNWTILIVIIIAVAAAGAGIYASGYFEEDEVEEKLRVEMGDTVTVHYTGWLEDDRIYDGRRVFDTSKAEIAGEPTFTFDERQRGDPFQFTVGERVIEGWSENVIGMREGQTKFVNIPPEKAYDTHSEDLMFTFDMEETIPVYESIHISWFESIYEMEPITNMVVTDHFWGWEKTVTSVEGERVNLRNEPDVGEYYHAYKPHGHGWRSRVVSIDSSSNQGIGEIVVQHHVERGTVVDAEHIGRFNQEIGQIPDIKRVAGQSQEDTRGIVVDVGEDNITVDFNEEVAGKTLRFRITVLEIQKQE